MKKIKLLSLLLVLLPLSSFTQNVQEKAIPLSHYGVILPQQIDFCGEEAPLADYYVREGLDRELLVNCYFHSATIIIIKRAYRYFPIIEPILKEMNIPDDFKYLAAIESSLSNAVSPAGAAGFWQFMKGTAKEYKLEVNREVDERYNLEKSTIKACEYLQESYDEWNNWTLVAATYNAGKTRIRKLHKQQQPANYYDMYLNTETSRYVYRILALKEIMENPQKYGFYIKESELYPPIKTKKITVDTTITDLPRFAKKMGTTYKVLKELNPWMRAPELPDESRKKYRVTLPLNGATNYDEKLKSPKSDNYYKGF